jgi:hypothetical protein
MKFIDEELLRVVLEVLKEGIGFNDPIAQALRTAYQKKDIHFSLRSKFGSLIATDCKMSESFSLSWKQNAFQVLKPEGDDTQKFIFSISSKLWEVLSCFTVNNFAFYTTITLNQADSTEQCLRAGIIKLMSSVSTRCLAVLNDFMQQLLKRSGDEISSDDPYKKEKQVFQRIAEFSKNVNCVALIDNDGFILNTCGSLEEVEKIASHLARFHKRCFRELSCLGNTNLRSEIFSCEGMSVLIGHIERTHLALAISVQGEYARSYASLLFELAQIALAAITAEKGTLWGSTIEKKSEAIRVRTSWFGAAQLVAQGKFVAKKTGKSFHLYSCKSLLKSEEDSFNWFEKRADAIRSGLIPCKSCNP